MRNPWRPEPPSSPRSGLRGSVRRAHGPNPSVARSLDTLHLALVALSTDMRMRCVVADAHTLQRDFPCCLKVGEGTARSGIVGQYRLPIARCLGDTDRAGNARPQHLVAEV